MFQVVLSVLFVCCSMVVSYAEMIELKNGVTVEGEILERRADSISVDVAGMVVTYYGDELARINGVEFVAEQTEHKNSAYDGMSKRDLVLKFIELYGTRQSMQQNFDHIANGLPPEQKSVFHNSFKVDEVVQALIPIYEKNFQNEELEGIIEFLKTPAGRSFVKALPQIMEDSVAVSSKYFEDHSAALIEAQRKNTYFNPVR